VINAAQEETPEKIVKELTSDRGADYVFVATGSTTAVMQGFNMIRDEGTVVIVGIPETGATVSLPVSQFVMGGGQRIMGSVMGSTRLSVDVPWLVNLYQDGRPQTG
ncbi:MAG: zinc-binding dehydrogenase, partial [Methanomicrobia archaeon]|nr:zinc-binding dehydrogenase [Methanomicrobia archaeon]